MKVLRPRLNARSSDIPEYTFLRHGTSALATVSLQNISERYLISIFLVFMWAKPNIFDLYFIAIYYSKCLVILLVVVC